MFPRPNWPVKIQQLKSCPSEAELKEIAEVARKDGRTQFDYIWNHEKHRKRFMISIMQSPGDELMYQWSFFLDADPEAKRLWLQTTDNFSQIHAMIVNSARAAFLSKEKGEEASSWDAQCSTFDGAEGLPIIQIDRLHDPEPDFQDLALKGELSLVGITNVLNSIAMSELSGRLRLDAGEKRADIFFFEGAPVHATSSMGDGMECMLRLYGLESGNFFFDPRVRTNEKTITDPLSSIILQGAKLADNTKYLTGMGLLNDSKLAKTNPNLSEQEFEKMLELGEPLEMSLMKSTYLAIDGESTLKEIIRKIGLSRTSWVPIIANLIRCKVIAIQLAPTRDRLTVVSKSIPPDLMSQLGKEFIDSNMRIFAFPAFMFMLEREVHRADADHPLSLVVFELRSRNQLTDFQWALARCMESIIQAKRRGDILGHYEQGQFAMMLPDTDGILAADIVHKLMSKILINPLIEGMSNTIQMSFGIASVPADAESMNPLLWAAEGARQYSGKTMAPVVLARDLDTHRAGMA